MHENQDIPTSLKVVAILFIIVGINAVIEVIVSLFNNHINIQLGVLGLFIGRGLLALRPGWRTCALVFLWIAMVVMPIFIVLLLSSSGPLNFTIFGQLVGHASRWLGLILATAGFALAIWQYRVLTHPDVRKLFDNNNINCSSVSPTILL